MLINIVYQDIKYNMNVEKEETLTEIKQFFITTFKLNVKNKDLLSWSEGNTPLIDDKKTLQYYNMWYENITLYFGNEYPEQVQNILKYYIDT